MQRDNWWNYTVTAILILYMWEQHWSYEYGAVVTLIADPEAYSYQLRWTPVGSEKEDAWITHSISTTRPATRLENLTPGTRYVFQARALTKSGFTDWSQPVTRMCT